MPPVKSKYVLNFLARTKQHGSGSVVTTGNDMYALFGFMNDQSAVYKIFQRLRRKILFIVRLKLMMKRNHAQKELQKLADAKRERAAKSAEFSFFRLIKFRKLPRGWRLFFNRGGYMVVNEMVRCMQRECLDLAICLANDAVLISESRNRHALLIKELQKLFMDTMSSIITEQLSVSSDVSAIHLPQTAKELSDDLLFSQEDSPASSLSIVDPINGALSSSTPAIAIIVAVFKRYLERATSAKSNDGVALNNFHVGLGFIADAGSYCPSSNFSASDKICYSDDAISRSLSIDIPKNGDLSLISLTQFEQESCSASRSSSTSQCSQVSLQNQIDDAYTSSDEFREFENLLTFTNDFAPEDVGSLVSDMLDCVCNSWLDIAPSQTPQCCPDIDNDRDATYTFRYDVPILPMATPLLERNALKPCSWGFYMCITFYTGIDLVCISAVHCGHELHLLSLSWTDFSSICLPCDSGVTVCLRFQGKFSSLIISQSQYNHIVKIRQALAARKLASIIRDNRIRDCNSFHSKLKADRTCMKESSLLPENSSAHCARTSHTLHRITRNRKETPITAKSCANLIRLRAKDKLPSLPRMPFLNLVKLLQSAISIRYSRAKMTPVLHDLNCSPVTPIQESSFQLEKAPKTEKNFSSQEHSVPKPPQAQSSKSSAELLSRSKRISTKLTGQLKVTCMIPKVFELQCPNNEESFQPGQIADKPKIISHDDFLQTSPPVTTPCAENIMTKVQPFDFIDNISVLPRLSDSRDSVTFCLPTAKKSDAASMMLLFTPQPPLTLPNKMLSPRVVTQKELLNEIPLTTQSPRQYVPQKLVARGRFKSGSIIYNPKQQQHASHVTLSLHSSFAGEGAADFKTVTAVSSDFISNLELPVRSVLCRSSRNQMMG